MPSISISPRYTYRLLLLLAAGVLLAVYWPALSGGFLFDDFANLPALGRYGPISDLPALLRYLTSGIADPTGRPVSMLSFLLDSRDWPADPFAFKRTNLLLHIVNSGLLAAVLYRLEIRLLTPDHARLAALGGAALWALHPLWVSTVAYVVQRHAMLPVSFVLVAILLWTLSNDAFERGQPRRGWLLALAAVCGCGLLAGLSKANGFLLPLLLLVLQETVLHPRPGTMAGPPSRSRSHRTAIAALLVLPACLIVLMLVWKGVNGWDMTHGRPWTLGQRLLTQPRVLMDYIGLLAWPRVHSPGLFGDGFNVSQGLLQPWTTLASLTLVLGATAWAIATRRLRAFAAGAVLFFLGGHALESSSIPLELYFEHRNYLPALLLGCPLAIVLTAPGRYRRARIVLLLVMLGVLAVLTASRSALWGNPGQLAAAWAAHLPGSARAQTHAALQEVAQGRPERAIRRLQPLLERRPNEAQFALTLVDAECSLGRLRPATQRAAETAIASTGVHQDMVHQWLRSRIERPSPACEELDDQAMARLLAAADRHRPKNAKSLNRLAQLHGLLAARRGACTSALQHFNSGLALERHAAQVFGQTGVLATHCSAAAALDHLRRYREIPLENDTPATSMMLRLHQRLLLRQGYWAGELDRMEALLLADIRRQAEGKAARTGK